MALAWLTLVSLNRKMVANDVKISKNEFTIGRDEGCDLSFPSEKRISAKHCIIFKENDKVFVKDLSTNGTFIRTKKIGKNQVAALHNTDELSLVVDCAEMAERKGGVVAETFVAFVARLTGEEERITKGVESDYVVLKTLGEGNFATVKKGIHKTTKEEVALKIIDKAKFAESSQALRTGQLDDEISIMKNCKHPHLLQVKAVYDSDKEIVLVLELAEKGDLFDSIVERKHYPESEAKTIFAQLAGAVDYLHRREIVHRDLKPENILLSENGIKVSDFGLSKIVSEHDMAKTLCGTPQYLAPEVIFLSEKSGVGSYGKEVDIWSMGVILFVMLAGYAPFDENRFSDIKTANFNFKQPVWKQVSQDAQDLIKKILVVDIKKRYTIPEIFKHPWMKGMDKYLNLEEDPPLEHFNSKAKAAKDPNPQTKKKMKAEKN